MIEEIKDFIKGNPSLVAGSAAVAILLTLNFGGEVVDIDSTSRKPASKTVRGQKRDSKFRRLGNGVKVKKKIGNSSVTKVIKKKKEEPTGATRAQDPVGFNMKNRDNGAVQIQTTNFAPDFSVDDPTALEEIPDTPTEEPTITEADDLGGDPGSSTGGGGGGTVPFTPPIEVPIFCAVETAMPGVGIYNENPYISITATDAATIYYCVTKSTTCNAKDSPIEYTTPILASTLADGDLDEGVFNLAYFCVSSTGEESDNAGPYSYTVDGTAIPIAFAQTDHRKRIQSNEIHELIGLTSTSFGMFDHDLFILNLEEDDPNSNPYSCADIADDPLVAEIGNDSVRSPASDDVTDVSGYDALDIFDLRLMLSNNLSYGDNWLVHFMRYTDQASVAKYGCINNNVEMLDFHVEQMMYNDQYKSAPNGNGVTEFTGGIKTWGDFSSPYISVSGQNNGIGANSTNLIEQDITNIIH